MRLSLVRIGILTTALAIGLAQGGCGVRGSLEYPDKTEGSATADSGQGKKEGAALKPHKPFVLDGLLR